MEDLGKESWEIQKLEPESCSLLCKQDQLPSGEMMVTAGSLRKYRISELYASTNTCITMVSCFAHELIGTHIAYSVFSKIGVVPDQYVWCPQTDEIPCLLLPDNVVMVASGTISLTYSTAYSKGLYSYKGQQIHHNSMHMGQTQPQDHTEPAWPGRVQISIHVMILKLPMTYEVPLSLHAYTMQVHAVSHAWDFTLIWISLYFQFCSLSIIVTVTKAQLVHYMHVVGTTVYWYPHSNVGMQLPPTTCTSCVGCQEP
jgi:hypothetical protein